CEICADSSRSAELLCVIEQPSDILPLEKTGVFRGRYHSLGGKISPLDHVAPEDLRIKELRERIDREKITEIIFALPADVEGEAAVQLCCPFNESADLRPAVAHGSRECAMPEPMGMLEPGHSHLHDRRGPLHARVRILRGDNCKAVRAGTRRTAARGRGRASD